MNEQDLRDCFAMFAMMAMLGDCGIPSSEKAIDAYTMADLMLEARKPKDVGIKAVKRTRKTNDEKD
jgi:hypothetical protein